MIKRFNLILAALGLLGDLLYLNFGGLWLKGITSFGFFAQGLGNYLMCRGKTAGETARFSRRMVWGLLLCFAADIVINLEFMSGAVIFALGHVLYLLAYCRLGPMTNRDLKIGSGIFAFSALMLLGLPMLDFGGGLMKLVCILYALVISLMVGKALGNHLRLKQRRTLILAVGSVLFFLSDFMLLLDVFGDGPRITIWLCLLFYYPAQCLLALACGEPSE